MALERIVRSTSTLTPDKQLKVSELQTDNGVYVDIREFIPSLEQYGRGVTFPATALKDVLAGLRDCNKR